LYFEKIMKISPNKSEKNVISFDLIIDKHQHMHLTFNSILV